MVFFPRILILTCLLGVLSQAPLWADEGDNDPLLNSLNALKAQIVKDEDQLKTMERTLGKQKATDTSKTAYGKADVDESNATVSDYAVSKLATSPTPPQATDQAVDESGSSQIIRPQDIYIPSSYAEPVKDSHFEIAPEFSYITYKEPSQHMRERGPFLGLYGAYTYQPYDAQSWPVNTWHIDAHFNYGAVDYKSPDGEAKPIDDYMIEPRFWVGHAVPLGAVAQWTPYIGIGYRFLLDRLDEGGQGGYKRRSQYLYAPVGFTITTGNMHGWKIGLNAEYDIFIHGWQTSYDSDIDPLYPNLNNAQHHGYGIRGALNITKAMNGFDLLISPYVRYWHIQQSDINTAVNQYTGVIGYEPANHSTEIGLKLGVEF